MSDFANRRTASKRAESATGHHAAEHPTWRKIRGWSVLEFTNRVMRALEVPYGNREIMSQLMTMALRDGEGAIQWRGATLSGEMILDVWRGSFDEPRRSAR